jgi:hypothetical protein
MRGNGNMEDWGRNYLGENCTQRTHLVIRLAGEHVAARCTPAVGPMRLRTRGTRRYLIAIYIRKRTKRTNGSTS